MTESWAIEDETRLTPPRLPGPAAEGQGCWPVAMTALRLEHIGIPGREDSQFALGSDTVEIYDPFTGAAAPRRPSWRGQADANGVPH